MVSEETNVSRVKNLLLKLVTTSDKDSLELITNFLEYQLIKNPIDPTSDWFLVSHPELDDDSQALMALIYDEDLTEDTSVKQLRKRFELVENQKEKFRGYVVYLYAFVGKGRILIFKGFDSNRDERIDISQSSIAKVSLFADNLIQLSANKILIEEDDFGFGKEVVGLDKLFKRELSNLFTLTVQLYRKHIAELITTNKILEKKILEMLPDYEQKVLSRQGLKEKLLNHNFKEAIGSVIDTIVLRVVLRRFLESYHGLEPFTKQDDFKDLGLGQREGKMQDVIQYLAEIQLKHISEHDLKAAIKPNQSGQVSWDLFENATHEIKLKDTSIKFYEIYDRLRKQFELAYGGDLFSSDVASIVNEVEQELNNSDSALLLHLMVDTSEDRFNFRYEDLPPEMIQEFYETSMGYSLQYSVSKEGEPIVSYSDDLQEKKHRGAYYTKQELVDYIVNNTIGIKMDIFQRQLNEAIKVENNDEILKALTDISNLTIVDLTCGGGSFLRGAFRYLSSKREGIVRTLERIKKPELYEYITEKFPYFKNELEAESLWERRVLLQMVYGIDIDYKALIISSQTLTLSALSNWQVGVNFPQLIGLTLIQQNALISPVRIQERRTVFQDFKQEIKEMIKLRKQIVREQDAFNAKKLSVLLEDLRLTVQEKLYTNISHIINEDYREALMPQSIEINFPEVFFNEDGELKEDAGFTISIGNPPWEDWNVNSEEFFEKYDAEFRKSNKQEKILKLDEIFKRDKNIKERWNWHVKYFETASNYILKSDFYQFQRVRVEGKYTGGHINLYKVALERSYQIISQQGLCGYLVPAEVYMGRGSTGIRHMLFNHTKLREIASFENRKNIFAGIDNRTKFAVLLFEKSGVTQDFKAFFYKLYLDALNNKNNFMDIPVELVKKLSPDTLSVLEFREQKEVDLMRKLTAFPLLIEEIKDKWNLVFNSEFNLTTHSSYFNQVNEGYPLYEGKSIWQFENKGPRKYWVSEKKGIEFLIRKEKSRVKRLNKNIQFKDSDLKIHSQFFRLAYREVASGTNKRSLISTVMPKNTFFGHTVVSAFPYIATNENNKLIYKKSYNIKDLLVIVGLFNSFIVDFIIRRKISTHVSIFHMYQLPIPRLVNGDLFFNQIVKRSALLICTSPEYDEIKQEVGIETGISDPEIRQLIVNQIDAYVAKIYGLSRDEFLYILSTFKSPKHGEEMQKIAQGVIEQFDVLCEKGELECPV